MFITFECVFSTIELKFSTVELKFSTFEYSFLLRIRTFFLLGTLINLQFEDIYRIWHVHHGISPAYGAFHLCADIVRC
jgi:hypothetical protein